MKFNLASNITDYVNSLYSVGCNVCINKPTRVTSDSATCIDHIYSNLHQDRICSNILMSDVSDHFSTLTKISQFSKSTEKSYTYSRKTDLNEKEWNRVNFELGNILHCTIPLESTIHTVNDQAYTISEACQIMINKFMPSRKEPQICQRRINKPWMNEFYS